MSIRLMDQVLNLHLPPAEKLVLVALADYADQSGYCFPRVSLLASRASISERGIQRILSKLEKRGLIIRQPRYRSDGGQTSSGYTILPGLGGANLSPPPFDRLPDTPRGVSEGSPPGVSPVTPLTTKEPISKNHHHHNSSDGDELLFPRSLSDEERGTARQMLDGLPADLTQMLLDELAGRIAAGGIRSSRIGYLRTLIARAREGSFVPEVGLSVASRRMHKVSKSEGDSKPEVPASREAVEKGIREMRSILRRRVEHA